jgi:thiol-disulfide isomerase/thioredoxin
MLPRKSPRSFLAVIAALATAVVAHADVKVGDAFPVLAPSQLVNLGGGEIPALDGKVSLVDFWASWCAPCKASFPAMAKLYNEYSGRGLQVVAVSIDEKPGAAIAFWKKMSPPFVALHDHNQKLVEQVVVPTMPTSYLLDRTGHVRFVHAGFHGDLAELRKEIETLLAEKS